MIPTTSKNDIDYIVKDIMIYKLGLDESQLTETAHLQEDLGIDSLDILELQTEVEKQFNIRIPDEEAERINTVGKLMRCVRNKMG
jgi:acyl carrier protein